MNTFRKVIFYFIILVSVFTIGATLLSLLYDVNVWWIKALDFPRPQLLVVGLFCLGVFAIMNRRWEVWSYLLVAGLLAAIVLQAYFVTPYSPLGSEEVAEADPTTARPEATVSLLLANVYMHNRETAKLLEIVEQTNPDMVLAMETNQWWMEALQPLQRQYAHQMKYPADNTYGMVLYSRYPLIDRSIQFLQHDSVPSFHAQVELPNGQTFHFHGVHPVPPIHSKYPDNKNEKEQELIRVGRMIAEHQAPAIVAGDFNDVAWSNTSRLFQVEGMLNDTRIGRGLYDSFDAKSHVMRWPLDHVYVTSEFSLLSFQRLDAFGSDHFPIFAKLVLNSE